MTKNSFVIVSNRLPVSVSRDQDGKLKFSVSSGGLATAMSSLEIDGSQVWIGWPGIASDDLTSAEKSYIAKELKKYNCVPVHLSKEQIALFYEGYANDTLWPLFHYFQSYVQYNNDYWYSYKQVNQLFAKSVKKYADAEATVWIQDYHFLLLPAMVRKDLPDSSIGFFLHIPFPSYEIFRLLPERKEIIEGLLGADLLGFHIYDYARHFASTALRLLGLPSKNGMIQYDGRQVKVDAYPIGIDYKKFRDMLKNKDYQEEVSILKQTHGDLKIMMSVDRLDYSKGILNRLEGFQLFLKENPKYLKKVKLVMIAVPSRTEVDTYKNLRDTIEQTVSRINGEFATVDWTPISYQFQNLDFDKIVALYKYSDVALVTPIRDGMNLVAKEYVASQTKNHPGVLVLSEMAGAIDELPEALSVNPNDTKSISRAIAKALRMSKTERLSRQTAMQERIAGYTVQRWGSDFIDDLTGLKKYRELSLVNKVSSAVSESILTDFKKANSKLILLDYDGTLQTFKNSPRPSLAKPSKALLKTLREITDKPGTKLYIVSGRKKSALESWFKGMNVGLIAEHGAWIKNDGVWHETDSTLSDIKEQLLPILEKYTSRTPGSLIEVKDHALVWHYRNVSADLGYIRKTDLKRELNSLLAGSDIGVYDGRSIIEVKPKDVNKGIAVKELYDQLQPEFVLCAGDDYTDEDMFIALPEEAYTIKVGSDPTEANFNVISVPKMVSLLEKIANS